MTAIDSIPETEPPTSQLVDNLLHLFQLLSATSSLTFAKQVQSPTCFFIRLDASQPVVWSTDKHETTK